MKILTGILAVMLAMFIGAPAQASTAQCSRFVIQTNDDAHRAYADVYTVQSGDQTTITQLSYRTLLLLWKADRLTVATSDGDSWVVRVAVGDSSKTPDDVAPRVKLKLATTFDTPVSWRVSIWDSSGHTHTTDFSSC